MLGVCLPGRGEDRAALFVFAGLRLIPMALDVDTSAGSLDVDSSRRTLCGCRAKPSGTALPPPQPLHPFPPLGPSAQPIANNRNQERRKDDEPKTDVKRYIHAAASAIAPVRHPEWDGPRKSAGSTAWLPRRTSKCNCGSVTLPVAPTMPIFSPR